MSYVPLEQVKVGDEVMLMQYSSPIRIVKVEKITPAGFIKVEGNLYYRTGRSRGETFSNTHIEVITPKLIDLFARRTFIESMRRFNFNLLTTDQMQRILNIVNEEQTKDKLS